MGFGSSSTRPKPFELNFWYVLLEAKIVLGSREKHHLGVLHAD
jgi:hypothetical protein